MSYLSHGTRRRRNLSDGLLLAAFAVLIVAAVVAIVVWA